MDHGIKLLPSLIFFTAFLFAQPESQSKVKLALLNSSDSSNFLTYQMVEIGVELPSKEAAFVKNFVERLNVPDAQKLNPYLEWELKVEGEFVHKVSGEKIVIDAFYFRDFEAWNSEDLPKPLKGNYSSKEYRSIGGYHPKSHEYPFRFRFSAPKEGEWDLSVAIYSRKQPIKVDESISFKVSKNNGNNGYMTIEPSGRYMELNNRTFYPLGCNLPWPETDTLSDPELHNRLCYRENGKYYRSNEGYRFDYTLPRVYRNYRNSMVDLRNGGGNYMRMIMYPSTTDIEWEKIGDYTDRLHMAQELDSILFLAEDLGLYIHWNMQIHFSFQLSERAYYRTWTWNTEKDGEPFCYRAIIGSEDPIDFFKDETAKMYYKQRLRYILSRWGYSTSIAVWELFSEISNVGSPKADNNEFYMTGDNYKIHSDWQKEMADYVKSNYYGNKHLLTASFAGEKHPKDDIYNSPNMDLMTSNIYDFGAPDMAFFYRIPLGKHYLNEMLEKGSDHSYVIDRSGPSPIYNTRPLFYSETDPYVCETPTVEMKRMYWQIPFSGLAGGLSWHMRFHPSLYSEFGDIASFLSRADLRNGKFHPCWATETDDGHWEYNYKYAERMFIEGKGKADLTYLRSKNQEGAIGVITNTTVNALSTGAECNSIETSQIESKYARVSETVSVKKEKIRVTGMKRGKYTIQYYRPGESTAFHTSKAKGNMLKLDVELGKTENDFILLFTVNKRSRHSVRYI